MTATRTCHEDQSKGINLDERENKETSHHAQQPEGTDTGGFRACNRNGVLPRLRRGMCFAEPAVSSTGGYVSTEWHQSLLTPWYPPMIPLVVVDGCEAVALESLCLSRTVLIRAIADTRFL